MDEPLSPEVTSGIRKVRLDAQSLKVLAHPLRARLLGALRLYGSATATGLAQRLGTNSGNTSYHLRKLAEVGLVEDAEGQGDGRDRWWRAAHDMTSWSETEFFDDPEASAAADWLVGFQIRANNRRTENWLEARHEWPREWVDASTISDYLLRLTPERARAMVDELEDIVSRYRLESDPGDPAAKDVTAFVTVHPSIGGLP